MGVGGQGRDGAGFPGSAATSFQTNGTGICRTVPERRAARHRPACTGQHSAGQHSGRTTVLDRTWSVRTGLGTRRSEWQPAGRHLAERDSPERVAGRVAGCWIARRFTERNVPERPGATPVSRAAPTARCPSTGTHRAAPTTRASTAAAARTASSRAWPRRTAQPSSATWPRSTLRIPVRRSAPPAVSRTARRTGPDRTATRRSGSADRCPLRYRRLARCRVLVPASSSRSPRHRTRVLVIRTVPCGRVRRDQHPGSGRVRPRAWVRSAARPSTAGSRLAHCSRSTS